MSKATTFLSPQLQTILGPNHDILVPPVKICQDAPKTVADSDTSVTLHDENLLGTAWHSCLGDLMGVPELSTDLNLNPFWSTDFSIILFCLKNIKNKSWSLRSWQWQRGRSYHTSQSQSIHLSPCASMYNAILRWKSMSVSKKLYKLYKHDHLEGLYPLQSKICRSPNQTVQWELPVPIYHHICHQNSSNMFSVFFQFQLGLDQSLQNRPWIWIVNLAHRSTDTDCTCKFWCRLWTMWTMWTWVNSDIYGLFNWCSWPLWRNMPVRSSKIQ